MGASGTSAAPAELPVIAIRPGRRRSASSGLAPSVILLLIAAAIGIGGYVAWPRLVVTPPSTGSTGRALAATAPEPKRPAPAPSSAAIPRPAEESTSGPASEPAAQERQREDLDRRESQRRAAAEAERTRTAEARSQATTEQERARVETDRVQAEQAEQEKARQDSRSRADSAVDRGLTDAYAAIRRGDQSGVEQGIAVAEQASGDDADLSLRVARWQLLADYARQLAGYREQAVASANQGREYTIDERTIAIIEIGPEKFAYKEAGRIKRGPRASLPKAIQRAILRAWFEGDQRAANHIFLGVDRLLDDQPDLETVRQEWETALAGEPATASIMPLLDDPVITRGR
jgi:hypothetical protein